MAASNIQESRRSQNHQASRAVVVWLGVVYLMIFLMVMIGGITRLTGSGLSMVEWRPLMGALPPLGAAEWDRVFAIYRESPQYETVNSWMELADFKRIFFWEYLHRLWGRLIGFVVLLPGIYFLLRRRLRGRAAWWVAASFVLGGLQGVLGWWMVKSGLSDRPEVSHFRLAAHLGLAFFVGAWIWWLLLDLRLGRNPGPHHARHRKAHVLSWGFLALLTVQIVYGAFMAGTRAGYLYSSWPSMNGAFLPAEALAPASGGPLSDPIFIHFLHRNLAWLVCGVGLWLAWMVRDRARMASVVLVVLLFLQFLLGVATVMAHMAVPLAAAHQGGAFLLLSAALLLTHQTRASRSLSAGGLDSAG